MDEVETKYCLCGHLIYEHSWHGCKACNCPSNHSELVRFSVKEGIKSENDILNRKLDIAISALKKYEGFGIQPNYKSAPIYYADDALIEIGKIK